MRFPNAFNGVKKIFAGEILALISAICALIAAVMAVIAVLGGATAADSGSDVAIVGAAGGFAGLVIFGIATAVLAVIAFIINIVGLSKASKDDDAFKISLFACILAIALTALSGFFTSNGFVSTLLTSFSTAADFLVTLFAIQGIRNLAIKLNNPEVDNRGATLFKIIGIVIVLEFAAELVTAIFGGPVATVTASVIMIAAGVLSVVKYLLYLGLLAKAKKMLAA